MERDHLLKILERKNIHSTRNIQKYRKYAKYSLYFLLASETNARLGFVQLH